MSPRGVAVPDVRERLFAAAERVLVREGTAGLTNRAITDEAGCAKGLLYNHFVDLDDFVAQLVLGRFERIAAEVRSLPERAGQGDVRDNLTSAVLVLLNANGLVIAAAAVVRNAVTERVRRAWATGAAGPDAVEDAVARYVAREQRLGRVGADTDGAMVALALVGTAHHLLMRGDFQPEEDARLVRRLVATLVPTAGGPVEPA